MSSTNDAIRLITLFQVWAEETQEKEVFIAHLLARLIKEHYPLETFNSEHLWTSDPGLITKKRKTHIKVVNFIHYFSNDEDTKRALRMFKSFPHHENFVVSKLWIKKLLSQDGLKDFPQFLSNVTLPAGRAKETARDDLAQKHADAAAKEYFKKHQKWPTKQRVAELIHQERPPILSSMSVSRITRVIRKTWG